MPPNAVPPVLRSTSLGWSRFLNSSDPGGTREGESGGLTLPLSFVSSLLFFYRKIPKLVMPIPSIEERLRKNQMTGWLATLADFILAIKPNLRHFFISHPILGQLWGVQLKLFNFLVQWRPNAFAPALIPPLYLCTNFKVYGIHCLSDVNFKIKTLWPEKSKKY